MFFFSCVINSSGTHDEEYYCKILNLRDMFFGVTYMCTNIQERSQLVQGESVMPLQIQDFLLVNAK